VAIAIRLTKAKTRIEKGPTMSIDVLMYKVQPLTENEFREMIRVDVNDLDEIDGWQINAYSFEEMSERPERFEHVRDYMQEVELMHTITDYKACAIAHGMPANTSCYSYTILSHKVVFLYNGCELEVAKADLDKFTTTTKETFYVLKRNCIDVDVDGWIARTLMKALEECGGSENTDLSYVPIHLNAQTCDKLCKILVDLHDKDELYPNAELAKFMLELMRAMCHQDDVFIEFQD
jgi:hypothetical protein